MRLPCNVVMLTCCYMYYMYNMHGVCPNARSLVHSVHRNPTRSPSCDYWLLRYDNCYIFRSKYGNWLSRKKWWQKIKMCTWADTGVRECMVVVTQVNAYECSFGKTLCLHEQASFPVCKYMYLRVQVNPLDIRHPYFIWDKIVSSCLILSYLILSWHTTWFN